MDNRVDQRLAHGVHRIVANIDALETLDFRRQVISIIDKSKRVFQLLEFSRVKLRPYF